MVYIAINILNLVSLKILKEDYPKYLDYTFFEAAQTNSSTNINQGDFILVDLKKSITQNDNIVYIENNNYLTGKVTQLTETEQVIENNGEEKNLTNEEIVGKIIQVVPQIGSIVTTLLKPISLIIAIVILTILTILSGHLVPSSKTNKLKNNTKN